MNTKTCNRCGATDLVWQTSKKGNYYLAIPTPVYGDGGRHIKTIYPAHRCEHHLAQLAQDAENARIEAERAEANAWFIRFEKAFDAGLFTKFGVDIHNIQEVRDWLNSPEGIEATKSL